MVELILVRPGDTPPKDERAIYVWPGLVQPAWGPLAAFERRPPARASYSDGSWRRAVDRAQDDAARAGYPVVYVVRNAIRPRRESPG